LALATVADLKATGKVDEITDPVLQDYLNDAEYFVNQDNIPEEDFQIMHKYKAMCLIVSAGLVSSQSVTSEKVGDVSINYANGGGLSSGGVSSWCAKYMSRYTRLKGFGNRVANL